MGGKASPLGSPRTPDVCSGGHGTRSRRQKLLLGVLAACVIVLVVAVPVAVTQVALHRRGGPLNAAYCDRLSGNAKAHCLSYSTATGVAKYAAAAQWRQASLASYVCAGIDVACLNADLESNAAGTSCRPLLDGAACGAGKQHCQDGYCGGAAGPAPATKFEHPRPTTKGDDQADDTVQPSEIDLLRTPYVPAAPNASWPTARATVWPSNVGVRVPQAFLATSHEWRRMTDYGGPNVQAFANIFKMLGATPVLRIGGSSQDLMTQLPGEETWTALKRLQQATGCKYLLGLPLHQKNATAMSRQLMRDAKRHLGPALLGFELGNEPEFWLHTGLGGYDEEGTWVPDFKGFAPYFHRVASELNPCDDPEGPQLSGPGWGNVNTQDPSWFAEIVGKGKCYLAEANTHYYPYINNETVTAPELLSQWLQDFALEKFKVYAKIAKEAGLGIRISETNSLYGGGRVGLSDTMTGAFWVADALFAFANAGARAFHLHWGSGGDPSGNSQPNTGVQTNFEWKVPAGQPPLAWPSVHAPWYGYLLWVVASAGAYGRDADTSFVSSNIEKWDNCTANIKLWALKSDKEELRITLLNKDVNKSCNAEVQVEASHCSGKASLSRMLPGVGGMFSKAGITLRGQHYIDAGITGRIQGTREGEDVAPVPAAEGRCTFAVALPASTAAILVVPGPAGASGDSDALAT